MGNEDDEYELNNWKESHENVTTISIKFLKITFFQTFKIFIIFEFFFCLKVNKNRITFIPFESNPITQTQLLKLRTQQRKQNKCRRLIREIIMNLIFLSVFFYVSYSSVNSNLYNYRNQLEKVFTGYDDVILNTINIYV